MALLSALAAWAMIVLPFGANAQSLASGRTPGVLIGKHALSAHAERSSGAGGNPGTCEGARDRAGCTVRVARGRPVGRGEWPAEPPGQVAGWLGMVLHTRGGLVFVKRVVEGWPAERAGLLAGDQLLSVNGRLAQAPMLDEALDALAGPAGVPVDVSIKRAGRREPLTVTLVRTSRPVPAGPGRSPGPNPSEIDARVAEDAVVAWSRGRLEALDRVLAIAARRPADRGPVMLLDLAERLLDVGGEAAWRAAIEAASVAVDTFPESPASLDVVRVCFGSGSRESALMRALAQRAIDTLAMSSQVPAAERASMTREWEVIQALGWIREGKTRKGERALRAGAPVGPVGLVALRANGEILWQVAVKPSGSWKDIVDHELDAGDYHAVWEHIKNVLTLDEPAWVYPVVEFLSARGDIGVEAGEILAPRWPVRRLAIGEVRVETEAGDRLELAEFLRGYPALLLHCPDYDRNCESWRVALADSLGRGEAHRLVTGIVTRDTAAPPSTAAWPVLRGELPDASPGFQATLLFLDEAGGVVGTWAGYEPGLEYQVLSRLRRFHDDPENAGPFLARGGIGRNAWTLRWSLADRRVSAVAWGGSAGKEPRMWLLEPSGELTAYQGGEYRWSLGGLEGLDRLQTVELDGDSADEFLAYRAGDGLLEALDGGPTPLWIAPGDDPIALVAGHDLDGDGLDEVLVAREGNGRLTCYRPDGSVRWQARVPNGIASLDFGRVVWAGELIAVSTTRREVYILTPEGRVVSRLDPGIYAGPIVFADVDGDASDELVVGGRDVRGLVAADLNADGLSEIGVRAGERQLILYRPTGRVATRLTWEASGSYLQLGEMDGDHQDELSLCAPNGSLVILNWLDPWAIAR